MLTVFKKLQAQLRQSAVLSPYISDKADSFEFDPQAHGLLDHTESHNTVFDSREHSAESLASIQSKLDEEGLKLPQVAYRLKAYKACWNVCVYMIDLIENYNIPSPVIGHKLKQMFFYLNDNTWVVRVLDKETYTLAKMLYQTFTALQGRDVKTPLWLWAIMFKVTPIFEDMQKDLAHEIACFEASQESSAVYQGEKGAIHQQIKDIIETTGAVIFDSEEYVPTLSARYLKLKRKLAEFCLSLAEDAPPLALIQELKALREQYDKQQEAITQLQALFQYTKTLPDKDTLVFIPLMHIKDAQHYLGREGDVYHAQARAMLEQIYAGRLNVNIAFETINIKRQVSGLIQAHLDSVSAYTGEIKGPSEIAEWLSLAEAVEPIYTKCHCQLNELAELLSPELKQLNLTALFTKLEDKKAVLLTLESELSKLKSDTFKHREVQESYEHFLAQIKRQCQHALKQIKATERRITVMLSQAAALKVKKEKEQMIAKAKERYEVVQQNFEVENDALSSLDHELSDLEKEAESLADVAQKAKMTSQAASETHRLAEDNLLLDETAKRKIEERLANVATFIKTLTTLRSIIQYDERDPTEQELQGWAGHYMDIAKMEEHGLDFNKIADAFEWDPIEQAPLREAEREVYKASQSGRSSGTGYVWRNLADSFTGKESPRKVWMRYIKEKLPKLEAEIGEQSAKQKKLTKLAKSIPEAQLVLETLAADKAKKEALSQKATLAHQAKAEALKLKQEERERKGKEVSVLLDKADIARYAYALAQLSVYGGKIAELPQFQMTEAGIEANLEEAQRVEGLWLALKQDYDKQKALIEEGEALIARIKEVLPVQAETSAEELSLLLSQTYGVETQQDFALLQVQIQSQVRYRQSIEEGVVKVSSVVTDLSQTLEAEQAKEAELAHKRAAFLKEYVSEDGKQLLSHYITQREVSYWLIDTFSWLFAVTVGWCFGYQTEKDKRRDYVDELKDEVSTFCDSGVEAPLQSKIADGYRMFKPRTTEGGDYPLTLSYHLDSMKAQLDTMKP